jgi:hypothetical protein
MGESRVIPRRTRRAVRQVIEDAGRVTIATGRAFAPTARFARILQVNAPLICYQGALIRDHRDGKLVHAATIPLEVAREVVAYSQARRLNVQAYTEEDKAYADQVDSVTAQVAKLAGVPVTGVGDLADWLHCPLLKLLYFVERRERVAGLVRELQMRFNGRVQVVRSWHQLVEVTGPGVSKGAALARLAAHLGVQQASTMAVGDQDNDASMIAWAGLGVAMGDASPAAKDVADVVAPPLSEEGAAWAIERCVLDG